MIVKYQKDDVWGYIDNVRQVGNKAIYCEDLIKQYDSEVEKNERVDAASYIDFGNCCEVQAQHSEDSQEPQNIEVSKLPENICASNKVFLMSTESLNDEITESHFHSENLVDGNRALQGYPANVILLYLNDHKEYETLVLVTNQKCFLMNDKGQTIERLV